MAIATRQQQAFPTLLAKDLRLALPTVTVFAVVLGACAILLTLIPVFGSDAMHAFGLPLHESLYARLSLATPFVEIAAILGCAAAGALVGVGDGARGGAMLFATVPASRRMRVAAKIVAVSLIWLAFMLVADAVRDGAPWRTVWPTNVWSPDMQWLLPIHSLGFLGWGLACAGIVRRPGWAVPVAIGLAVASAVVVSIAASLGLATVMAGIDRWDSMGIEPRFVREYASHIGLTDALKTAMRIDIVTATCAAGIGIAAASVGIDRLGGRIGAWRARQLFIPLGVLALAAVAGGVAGLAPRGDGSRLRPALGAANADARAIQFAYASYQGATPEEIVRGACMGRSVDSWCLDEYLLDCLADNAYRLARNDAESVSHATVQQPVVASWVAINEHGALGPETVAARMVMIERCAQDPAPISTALQVLLREQLAQTNSDRDDHARLQAASYLGPSALGNLAAHMLISTSDTSDRVRAMGALEAVCFMYLPAIDTSGRSVAPLTDEYGELARWPQRRARALRALGQLHSEASSRSGARPLNGGLDVNESIDLVAVESAQQMLRDPMPWLADALIAQWSGDLTQDAPQRFINPDWMDQWKQMVARETDSLRGPAPELAPVKPRDH